MSVEPSRSRPTGPALTSHEQVLRVVSKLCSDYVSALEAIRRLLDGVIPLVTAMDQPKERASAVFKVADQLNTEERQALSEMLQLIPDNPAELMKSIIDRFPRKRWAYQLIGEIIEATQMPPLSPIAVTAIVTTAVSAFEWHIGQVAGAFFRLSPEALTASTSDPTHNLSLADLKSVASIEEAIELIIDRRVAKLMFGSLDDWQKFFFTQIRIKLDDLAPGWDRVQEVLQRRNIIIHHSSRASTRYIQEVRATNAKVGDLIATDADYARSAIDSLLCFGYLLSIALWKKFAITQAEVDHNIDKVSYRLLTERRFTVALGLANYGRLHAENIAGKSIHLVNYWQCRRALDGDEVIRAEVDNWDVSGMEDRFKLAKACLRHDMTEAFRLVHRMRASGSLLINDLLSWPLFEEIRKDPRFEVLMPDVKRVL